MVAPVNGYQFEGPGIIVREWPLRGVAICPYGADANTESAALAGANAKTYTATAYAKPNTQESDMKADEKPVEVAAQAQAPEAVVVEKQDEVKPVETPAEAAAPAAVEATAPEGNQVTEQAQEAAPEAKPLSREEFTKIADEFGAAIAVQTVRDGGDYSTALRLAFDASKAEAVTLRGRVAELESKTKSGGQAVPVSADKPKPKLFNTGK
jgi:hypothetical protein